MTIASLLLFVNYRFSNDIVSLMVTLSFCLYILGCKKQHLIASLVFLSLFFYLTTYNSINLSFLIIFTFILRSLTINPKNISAIIVLIVSYFFTHVLSTDIHHINIALISSFFSMICILICSSIIQEEEISLVSVSYLYSFLIASLLGFFKNSTRLIEVFDSDEVLGLERYSGLSYDPNFYTMLSLVALVIIIKWMRQEGGLFYFLILSVTIALGMLTLSKSFYLCVLVLLVYSVFSSQKKGQYILYFTILFLALMPLLISEITPLLDVMIQRFDSSQDFNELSTNRYDLWIMYMDYISKGDMFQLIFGNGAVLPKEVEAAHNTYLEIIYKFGIIGFMMDSFIIVKSIKQIMKFTVNRIELFLFCGIMAILIFNLSCYTFFSFWSCLFVILIMPVENKQNAVDKSAFWRVKFSRF